MTVETAREVMERCRTLATYSEEPGFITRTFLAERAAEPAEPIPPLPSYRGKWRRRW